MKKSMRNYNRKYDVKRTENKKLFTENQIYQHQRAMMTVSNNYIKQYLNDLIIFVITYFLVLVDGSHIPIKEPRDE